MRVHIREERPGQGDRKPIQAESGYTAFALGVDFVCLWFTGTGNIKTTTPFRCLALATGGQDIEWGIQRHISTKQKMKDRIPGFCDK